MDKEKHLKSIAFNNTNIGERCYPGESQKRTIDDHLARYDFVKEFVLGKNVLDIACGEGYGSDILKKSGAESVTGADNDAKIIARAKETYSDINFVTAEATITPFLDNYFDVIISFETWHHLDRYKDFIPEMARILKPGGRLALSVPNKKVIYLNPFHRKFLTPYYRTDFDKKKIEKYVNGYLNIEQWYGQRFVKRRYLNIFVKLLLYLGQIFIPALKQKTDSAFKLADGAAVKPLIFDNARYLIALCRKIN